MQRGVLAFGIVALGLGCAAYDVRGLGDWLVSLGILLILCAAAPHWHRDK